MFQVESIAARASALGSWTAGAQRIELEALGYRCAAIPPHGRWATESSGNTRTLRDGDPEAISARRVVSGTPRRRLHGNRPWRGDGRVADAPLIVRVDLGRRFKSGGAAYPGRARATSSPGPAALAPVTRRQRDRTMRLSHRRSLWPSRSPTLPFQTFRINRPTLPSEAG